MIRLRYAPPMPTNRSLNVDHVFIPRHCLCFLVSRTASFKMCPYHRSLSPSAFLSFLCSL